ncbi:MAG: GC-type dockerin domain-anchored protein [Phycisphaerales bacterium JB040]
MDRLNGFNGANGLSWGSAFPTLTWATFVAQPGDEIWLTITNFGTSYSPSDFYIANGPGGSRSDSFVIPSGVTVRGGFLGSETDPSQRPFPDLFFDEYTRLDGSVVDNYHVVTVANGTNVVLDRVIIEHGKADGGTLTDQVGGGVLALDSELTLIDCGVSNNDAQIGGGIYAENCDLAFSQDINATYLNVVANNNAIDDLGLGYGFGGGLFMGGGGTLTFDIPSLGDFSFAGNDANVGGGMHLQDVSVNPGTSEVTFNVNRALARGDGTVGYGGAIHLYVDSNAPTFALPGLNLQENSAVAGGGIFASGDGVTPGTVTSPSLVLRLNESSSSGGGLYVTPTVAVTVDEIQTIDTNSAGSGGGVAAVEGSLTILGGLIEGNNAVDAGGAIWTVNGGGLQMSDTVVQYNFAPIASNILLQGTGPTSLRRCVVRGGSSGDVTGVRVGSGVSASLTNVLVTEGTLGAALQVESGGSLTGKFLTIAGNDIPLSVVAGGTATLSSSIVWGNSDLISDPSGGASVSYSAVVGGWPGTGNINSNPQLDSGYGLTANSPAIDAANGSDSFGITTDLAGNNRERDDPEQPDTGVAGFLGSVPDMGAYEFQGTSEQLLVEVPSESATVAGAMSLVRDGGTVQLSPGFYEECLDSLGKELTIQSVDPFDSGVVNSTYIICSSGSALTVSGGSNVTVDGLILLASSGAGGSALRVTDGHADVFRCPMQGDNSGGDGGTAYVGTGASASFTDSGLSSGRATRGGGLFVAGLASLHGCDISGNRVQGAFGARGAGVFVDGTGAVIMDRSVIRSNMAQYDAPNNNFTEGGGVWVSPGGSAVISNTLVRNNSAWGGAGLFSENGTIELTNVTMVKNNSGSDAGGIKVFGASAVATIANSIIWGNTDPNPSGDDDLQQFLGAVVSVSHSNMGSVNLGGTNLSEDPGFVDFAGGLYRLAEGSPCIDSGSNALALSSFDLDGATRYHDDTGTPDTGEGTAPVVDMGAYEFQGTTFVCPADVNYDGVVDNGDIGAFIGLFLTQDPAADFTGDGIVDNGDIGAFISAFLAGC